MFQTTSVYRRQRVKLQALVYDIRKVPESDARSVTTGVCCKQRLSAVNYISVLQAADVCRKQ